VTDALELARQAIAGIGSGWEASDHERELLDFKETPETAGREAPAVGSGRKRFFLTLADTAACLANGRGGVIVLGVRDRAPDRAAALQGVDKRYVPEQLRREIYNRTSPGLPVDASEETVDGARLILLRIPTGVEIHSTTGGTFKHRVGDQCQPLDSLTMRGLRAARGAYDWTALPSHKGPDAVSVAALDEAASRLQRRGDFELATAARADPSQFLRDTGLVAEGKLTRAGILLYGSEEALRTEIAEWGVILRTAPSPGSEGTVLMRREDARRPLVLLLDEILARLSGLITTRTLRVGAEQIELEDYPEDAVRELVANAFAHRDWEISGVVDILHSPQQLSVSSPGALLPTLHAHRLLRESAQRNSLLAREMARLRLAELAGLGFDRVYRELARIGKQPPEISDGPRFIVSLNGGAGDEVLARYLASANFPSDFAGDLDVLLILGRLRHKQSVNANAIAPLLQRDPNESERALRRMQDAGLIEPTRSSARRQHPSYRLSPTPLAALRTALSYRTETVDSDDQKLIRHLQRYGRITNADVRDFLGCDVATARNRLRRLRDKGWIDFAPDSARRGPDVSYVKQDKLDTDAPRGR
jgi:ATP-dependent DNA helicase RecG